MRKALLVLLFLSAAFPAFADSVLEQAEAGDPAANVELGRQYFFGDQVSRDYGLAFNLWNRAIGLGGSAAECQIVRLGDTETADGMFITGLSLQHGWCHVQYPEPVLAFKWLHRAGQAYIEQGQLERADYILSVLLQYDHPFSKKYAQSLQKSLSEALN